MSRRLSALGKPATNGLRAASHYAWDLTSAAGLALLAVGLWRVSPALSLIVVGLALLAAGLFGARAQARRGEKPQHRDDAEG